MQEIKIKCPHCDTEYLPGEIFIPNYFLGQPKDIERDITGKIIYNTGLSQDTKEEFVCEKCGKKFIVNADIKYNTFKSNQIDMDEEYSSEKYTDRLYLKED